jgi:hypothetical protein
MSYIGQGLPADTFQGFTTDKFTGDGTANKAFTLTKEPFSEDTILVTIDGVVQEPTDDFTVSGTTLTLVGTAANGSEVNVTHMGGPLPIGGAAELDLNGASDKLILDADADTTISADTDDQIDFKVGGTDIMSLTATTATINDGTTITVADNTDNLTLTSTDADENNGPNLRLYRNSSSPADNDLLAYISIDGRNDNSEDVTYARIQYLIKDASDGTEDAQIDIPVMQAGTRRSRFKSDNAETVFNEDQVDIDFRVESNSQANMFTIDAGNEIITIGGTHATPGNGNTTQGASITEVGRCHFNVTGTLHHFNRTEDGDVVGFGSAGGTEGYINISGSTTNYGAFCGSHWSRLADNSKPTILRGTIMESIDEMCDWYQAEADVEESTDENGGVTPAYKIKEPIALPNGKSVGDAVTFTVDGVEHTGVYKKEDDIKHVKSKISDTSDSTKVYGLFMCWDDADDGRLDDDVNDLKIAQVGTYVIRVNKDVTVEAGDLLVSNGDGTAKKQDDDIIRSKTVAKVNSNVKVETYSDGSYTVPCTLHC